MLGKVSLVDVVAHWVVLRPRGIVANLDNSLAQPEKMQHTQSFVLVNYVW
jgi:hypothetical protein